MHLSRLRDFSRKCMEITEVVRFDNDSQKIILNPIFKFQEDKKNSTRTRVVGRLVRTGNKIINTGKFELSGIYDYLEDEKGAEG